MKNIKNMGMTLKVISVALIVLTAAGIYLSLQEKMAGPYLGVTLLLFLLLCVVLLLEAWRGQSNSGGNNGDILKLTQVLSELPDHLKSSVGRIEEQSANAIKVMKEPLSALQEKEIERLKGLEASSSDILKELSNLCQAIIAAQRQTETFMEKFTVSLDKTIIRLESNINSLSEFVQKSIREFHEDSMQLHKELTASQDSAARRLQEYTSSREGLFDKIGGDITRASEKLEKASTTLEEAGNMSHVNQAGLQAGIEMLNSGLAKIFEKTESLAVSSEDEKAFMQKLHDILEAFHEKATEILIENSLKTREILVGNSLSAKDDAYAS